MMTPETYSVDVYLPDSALVVVALAVLGVLLVAKLVVWLLKAVPFI